LEATLPLRELQAELCRVLDQLGALPKWRLVDSATGKAAWGVEWLPAKVGGRTVISAVNLTHNPVRIKILRGDRTVAAADLLSLGGRGQVDTLQPMTPVLAVPGERASR
jgi:hypothetical protein